MRVAEPGVEAFTNGEPIEGRYIALASLARRLPSARTWEDLAIATGQALGTYEPAVVRLWAMTDRGFRDAGRARNAGDLPELSARDLTRALDAETPVDGPGGSVLVALQADGVGYGVLEVHCPYDAELIAAAAPLIALRLSALRRSGKAPQIMPVPIEESDPSAVIQEFARQAKQLLDHDRLSVYLVDHDGRAFERFAVATSALIPGEGVRIPFEDVGLRHIILSNQPIVSSDLGADPRLIGAEDRVIARAGFRGLLSVPLRAHGRPFGVLNFVSRKAGFYRQEDVPIAQQIADQIAAFVENLRRQRQLHGLVRERASERERTRIARDVYQAVSQAVPQILDSTQAIEAEGNEPAKRHATQIRAIAERGLADMRRAIVDLDPPGLESGGLRQMIEQALKLFAQQTECETDLRIDGDLSSLPQTVATTAYRVLQEALLNARLHADATEVTVKVSTTSGFVLEIEDDGRGFDTREALHGEGLGLRHMRERSEAIGAFLTIQSDKGSGTSVRLNVPDLEYAARRDSLGSGPDGGDPPPESTLRIFVGETNSLLRAGLSRLIEGNEDMRIVGEASSREHLRTGIRQLHPDVLVLSTALANGDLKDLVGEISEISPSTEILAISHGDVSQTTELIDWGITGVIHLPIDEDGLNQAVRAVAAGTHVLGQRATADHPGESLTARERSILALVAAGLTNAQIGKQLYLATKTVERQVATIVRKLNASNRAHAAAIGVARRIVELPEEAL